MMETREAILKRDFSNAFIEKMKNAIETSHYKYGWMSKTYPELAQAYKCIEQRLEMYLKTHNTEYLVDVANFARTTDALISLFREAQQTTSLTLSSDTTAKTISFREERPLVFPSISRTSGIVL